MDIFDQFEGTIEAPAKPRRFVFVLLEEFTMLCFSAAVESLRIANRMSGKELYTWALVSEDGAPVRCSAGIEFVVQHELIDVLRDDTLMVCGGVNIKAASSKKIVNWLRRESRRGPLIAGLCTAGYTLAKAGLLDGKRATIHWENQDSFIEEFEDVELTKLVSLKKKRRNRLVS